SVTGGGDGGAPFEAKVWDARTGMFLFDLKGLGPKVGVDDGKDPFVSVAFSADSKRLVTAGGDSTARVWDAATGALQLELNKYPTEIKCAAFSPDGTQIATGSVGGVVIVWDARTGKGLREWEAEGARVAFSPDGTRILTGSGSHPGDTWLNQQEGVRVWDARTGTLLLDAKGAMGGYCGLAFSPDGKRIVA